METLLDALKLDLIISIPQAIVIWMFVLSFLRPLPDRFYTRIVVISIIHSVYTDTIILLIPVHFHIINSFCSVLLLVFLVFKELPLRKKLFLYSGSIITSIMIDLVTTAIAMWSGAPNVEELRREYLHVLVGAMYPELIILLIAAWFIRRRTSKSLTTLLSMNIKGKRTTLIVFSLLIAQFIVLGSFATIQNTTVVNNHVLITTLIYGTIAISLGCMAFMIRLLTTTKSEAIRTTQALYVDDINDMFTSMRGQRHDFLNHVQVIHTMASMGKLDQLRDYTSTLVQETREVSDIMHHSSPALAAFAQAKTTVAVGYGIAFDCRLPADWSLKNTAVQDIDIIKMLGNLVDNAFDESILLPAGHRQVNVQIGSTDNEIVLEVTNRGRALTEQDLDNIFKSGYTTKGDGHSGLGLAIVKERVHYYQGTLSAQSDPFAQTTTFNIVIPYKQIKSA